MGGFGDPLCWLYTVLIAPNSIVRSWLLFRSKCWTDVTPDTTLSNSVKLDSPKKLDRMVVGGGRCDIWVWLSSEENCLKHTNNSSESSEMMERMKKQFGENNSY